MAFQSVFCNEILLCFLCYSIALEDLEKKLQSSWRSISVTHCRFCKTVFSSFIVTKNDKCYLLKQCKFGAYLGPTVLAHSSLCLPVLNSILFIITTKESKKLCSSEKQELGGSSAIIPKESHTWAAFPSVLDHISTVSFLQAVVIQL